MPEEKSQITIISDLLKRDPAYKEVIDQLEERLYNRYMVYLADKPKFNAKTQAIAMPYLNLILSFKNTLETNRIAKKYNLSQEQRDGLPAILWKIFYHEAEIKNLPQMLNSELALGNIRSAYALAIDIANLYSPISDYLGDIPMTIKRWQYEAPVEEISIKPPTVAIPQTIASSSPVIAIRPPTGGAEKPAQPATQTAFTPNPNSYQLTANSSAIVSPSVPPIRPRSTIMEQHLAGKSELEPEYLPDEPPAKISASQEAGRTQLPDASIPEEQENQVHPANIIDLKNF